MTVKKGEFVAILGKNGCGKSTLAGLLNGILMPCEGDILVSGLNIKNKKHIFKIRQKVGIVMQNPEHQIFEDTVWGDVCFGPKNLGFSKEEAESLTQKALENAGILDLKNKNVDNLSGGQKQKLAIADVLAMNPEYIIFDESLAMLDPISRNDIFNLILNLNKNLGVTIILITHSANEAIFADRVIFMNCGKISKDCKPSEIFSFNQSDIIKIEQDFLRILNDSNN